MKLNIQFSEYVSTLFFDSKSFKAVPMQSEMSRNRQPHAITPVNNTAPVQNVWRFSSADSTTKQTTHDPGRTVQSDPRLTLILCC